MGNQVGDEVPTSREVLWDACRIALIRSRRCPSKYVDLIVEVLDDGLDDAAQHFATKGDLQTMQILQDDHLSDLKSVVERSLKFRYSILHDENGGFLRELEHRIWKTSS
ncbi:uncharacterized protein LOC115735912 [Rhodamnia argentea]|uniref:Uncharacterized protein LOC115735912 n=1 Tax=Rhodamnia argentea TaxID=178133 RepID=A0A8B8NL32_9MYRT|nr:uncharacterized protein LOC115735912 [Rhodamnia argentea]